MEKFANWLKQVFKVFSLNNCILHNLKTCLSTQKLRYYGCVAKIYLLTYFVLCTYYIVVFSVIKLILSDYLLLIFIGILSLTIHSFRFFVLRWNWCIISSGIFVAIFGKVIILSWLFFFFSFFNCCNNFQMLVAMCQ